MKRITRSPKFFQRGLGAALAIVIAWGLSVRPALAGYMVTMNQVGTNVVAIGSGAIDLTGLTFNVGEYTTFASLIYPNLGTIITGPTTLPPFTTLAGTTGTISGPTTFGSGGLTQPNFGTGQFVGIIRFSSSGPASLVLPNNYVSGTGLLDDSIYFNQSFSSLGVMPGTYEWTWGTGMNENFTLQIESVPDAGSTLSLLSFASLGLVALRRKLRC